MLSRRAVLGALATSAIVRPAAAAFNGIKLYTPGPNPGGYAEILVIGDSETARGMALNGLSTTTPGFNINIDVCNPLCFERRWQGFGGHSYTLLSRDPFDWPGGVAAGAIGFIQTFLRAFAASSLLTTGQCVRATAAGVSGTTFAGNGTNGYWWNVTGNSPGTGTTNALSYINGALAENASNYLAAILIAGCPNDIVAGTTQANFLAALVGIVGYFRANVTGASNVPVIGTSCPYNFSGAPGNMGPISAWEQFTANVTNSAYIDTGFQSSANDLVGYPDSTLGGDAEHFTNVSMRALGQRMLTALEAL